jgi:hypothetical protein
MGLFDQVKNVLLQYTSSAASPQGAAAHFDEVAQATDSARKTFALDHALLAIALWALRARRFRSGESNPF